MSLHKDPRLATRNVSATLRWVQRCSSTVLGQVLGFLRRRDRNATIAAVVALALAPLGAYYFFAYMGWAMSDGTGTESGKLAGRILHLWWCMAAVIIAISIYAKGLAARLFCVFVCIVYCGPALMLALGAHNR
jgi:hypothetical protein